MQSSIDLHFPELAPLIDRWLKPTSEIANLGVPPHLTLLWPWQPAPVLAPDLTKLKAAIAQFNPYITLAKPSRENSEALKREIIGALTLPIQLAVNQIVVMEEHPDKHWFIRVVFPLFPCRGH